MATRVKKLKKEISVGEVGEVVRKDGDSVTIKGASSELQTFTGVGRPLEPGDEIAIPDLSQKPFENWAIVSRWYDTTYQYRLYRDY